MSKKRLIMTILIFVLTIALVVGASYLFSLLFKNRSHRKAVGDTAEVACVSIYLIKHNQ